MKTASKKTKDILTDPFCKTAAPGVYADGDVAGLEFRVGKTRKTWGLTYTPYGKTWKERERVTLTTYPIMGVLAARKRARELLLMVAQGIDLNAKVEKASEGGGMLMRELVAKRDKEELHRLKTRNETMRIYENNVLAIKVDGVEIGDWTVEKFVSDKKHLHLILDPIKKRGKTIMVNRVYAHVTALMNFAVDGEDQIIPSHPFALKRRVRKNVLFPEKVKTRYLEPDEIRKVWHVGPQLDYRSSGMDQAIQLILSTAQRPGEVLEMERSHIDEKKLMWTITDTKNGTTQTVPLNRLAMSIIKARMEKVKGKFLFPHSSGKRAHDASKLGAIARNLVEPMKGKPMGRLEMVKWTPHDLRRTVSTLMSMKEYGLCIPEKHISRVLNHKMRTSDSGAAMTAKVYNQNPYWEEKKEALEKWNDFLEGILGFNHDMRRAA